MSGAGAYERTIGRYAIHDEIACGGMASVHLGYMRGAVGFERLVAIKRIHQHMAKDPSFVAMFVDEARLAARLHHPNVVSTIDVVESSGEVLLVLEYIKGESLARLLASAAASEERCPPEVAASIVYDVLHGLEHAHTARDKQGWLLGVVHRDVSPQNILVGVDGVSRVLDFGIAKAYGRIHETRDGTLKGKLSYMAPEVLRGEPVTRAADIFAAGVVLWEALTGRHLFDADSPDAVASEILSGVIPRAGEFAPGIEAFEPVLSRALAGVPGDRYATAVEMALALEKCAGRAPPSTVAEFVARAAKDSLDARAALIARMERAPFPISATMPAGTAVVDAIASTHASLMAQTPASPAPSPKREGHPLGLRVLRTFAFWLAAALPIVVVTMILVARSRESSRSAIDPPPGSARSEDVDASNAAMLVLQAAPAEATASSTQPEQAPEPTSASPRRRAQAPAIPKAKPNCNPPYSVDSAGRKHFKLECVHSE